MRQKEGNAKRIFCGVSQLINSVGFERKMGGRSFEVERTQFKSQSPDGG